MVEYDDGLRGAWARFRESRDLELRNQLVQAYLPLVQNTAERLHAKLPSEVEFDDLFSAGVFGLVEAVEAFDVDRQVKFETYCLPRIRGAILDELRSWDWVPRLVRTRYNRMRELRKRLIGELGRKPTDDEMARAMGLSVAKYHELASSTPAFSTISLSRTWEDEDSNSVVEEADLIQDRRATAPDERLGREDLRQLISKGLGQKERLVIILYYYEEMTMKEIGRVLGLSESRISQMHAGVLLRLKKLLAERRAEFAA
jgi:RNA polymerase sigma factor for flagellar operon FliA